MQRENFKPKEHKAKHGLMIRPKYLILVLARAWFWEENPLYFAFLHLFKVLFGSRRRKGKKEEKKEGRREVQEIKVWKYLSMFGLGNFPTSFFGYM